MRRVLVGRDGEVALRPALRARPEGRPWIAERIEGVE